MKAHASPKRRPWRNVMRIAGTLWFCLCLLGLDTSGPPWAAPVTAADDFPATAEAVPAALPDRPVAALIDDFPATAEAVPAALPDRPATSLADDAFEPITHTILPGGTYTFTTVYIPAAVVVTVTGEVLITVTGDLNIAGSLVGDCFGINLQALGNITITGVVDNRCSGDPDAAGDLLIYTHGGNLALGTIAAPAEVQTSGDLDITNDPTLEEWEFDVPPHQRSATLLPPVCAASTDTILDMVMVFSPTVPFTPTEIAFYGEGVDPDGGPVTYQWDFGDGGTSSERDPWHSYTVSGTYDVALTVTDDDGQTCQATLRLVLGDTEWNLPPGPAVAAEPVDLVSLVGDLAYFYSDALDPQWEDLTYRWDLGDGTVSAAPHPTHTYSATGRYAVTLTVTDTEGLTATATASVYVHAAAAFELFLPYVARGTSTNLVSAPAQGNCVVPGPNVFNVVYDGGKADRERTGRNITYRGRGNIVLGPGTSIKAQDGGDGRDRNGTGSVLGGHGKRGGSLQILVNGQLTICGGAQFESGSGGRGGHATSNSPPTQTAHARGGNGGRASQRLAFRSTQGISFESPFGNNVVVNPGDGGDGGNATATGGTGAARCPRGQNGAKAITKGGDGGKASKAVVVSGRVTGLANVEVQGGQGGHGGTATATAGGGGNAVCLETATGGTGQPAYATGGKGGDATLSGAIGGMNIDPNAFTAGNGGEATATGGTGGTATATANPCEGATATGGAAGSANAYGGNGGKGRNNGDGGDATARGGGGGVANATGGDCDQDCVAGGAATATGKGGGAATARYGRKGGPGAQDGNADATGGNGGAANATGGNGAPCHNCPGGDGGAGGPANATGGKGGDASSNGNTTQGGNGGDANATGGNGGKGADCCHPPLPGGDGGPGGPADSYAGRPGSPGGSYGGNAVKGGDGGDGGEGEPPGQGGDPGIGTGDPEDIPDGERGEDGPPCPGVCVPVDDPVTDWTPLYPTPSTVITFTGSTITGTPPITFSWSFGDGGLGIGEIITHIYELTGDYTVSMTATNECGQASISNTITVLDSCEPVTGTDFTWDPVTPTVGDLVTFYGTATGTLPIDYFWDFGDGITATGKMVQHIYEVSGTYQVTLATANACGQEFISYPITVLPACEPVYGTEFTWDPAEPLVGEPVTFYGSAFGTPPIDYFWDFGDGITETGATAVHIYEMEGIYPVTLWTHNACGDEWVSHDVTVLPLCEPPHDSDFTWEPPIPTVGQPVIFDGIAFGTPPITFSWSFGDGGIGIGATVVHIYEFPGYFMVDMIVENECGYEWVSHEIMVMPPLGAAAGHPLARWIATSNPPARPGAWARGYPAAAIPIYPAAGQNKRPEELGEQDGIRRPRRPC